MSTLAIASPVRASNGLSYTQNVGRAARALLAALLAVTPRKSAPNPVSARSVQAASRVARDDLSLYRLYCLSSPYDSVMPNLAQELRAIAARG